MIDVLKYLAMFALATVPSGAGWQKDNTVTVSFVDNPNSYEYCGVPPAPMVVLACVDKIGGSHMTLPNPCKYRDNDSYARLVCHELGHTNGWRHEYK